MKRCIKNASIFGMSFSRKEAIDKMKAFSPRINEHVVEGVVYKELRGLTLHHWANEIATPLCRINKMKCDSKIKESDIRKNLFGSFGTCLDDAEINLAVYQAKNLELPIAKQYPDFEITDDLIMKLFKVYQSILDISISILLSKEVKSLTEWAAIIEVILKDEV